MITSSSRLIRIGCFLQTHRAASSVSVIRPISEYLNVPLLAHAMTCSMGYGSSHNRHGYPYFLTTAQISVKNYRPCEEIIEEGTNDMQSSAPQLPRIAVFCTTYILFPNRPHLQHE